MGEGVGNSCYPDLLSPPGPWKLNYCCTLLTPVGHKELTVRNKSREGENVLLPGESKRAQWGRKIEIIDRISRYCLRC